MRKLAGSDHALPIECSRDAAQPFAAGGEERGDHQHQHEGAHARYGSRTASRGDGRPALQRLGSAQAPLDMGAPQRDREQDRCCRPRARRRSRCAGRWRKPVLRSSRRRPSTAARQAQHQHRRERAAAASRKKTPSPMRAPDRRQPQPERRVQEAARNRPTARRDRRQRRPQPLPQDRPARARPSARDSTASRLRSWSGCSSAAPVQRTRSVKSISSKENLANYAY